uniref:Peptidase n=1 Tax=Dulem virus 221 TaxID=3145698 RepID=A0AAU8B269_9VIRU
MKKTILRNSCDLQSFAPVKGAYPLLHSALFDYTLTIAELPFKVVVDFAFDSSDVARIKKLDNSATVLIYERMLRVAVHFYSVLESLYAKSEITDSDIATITITSQYRSVSVNSLVGGSPNSLHRYGLALDVKASTKMLNALFHAYSKYFNTFVPVTGKVTLYPKELIKYYVLDENSPAYLHIGFAYTLPRLNNNNVLPF